MKKKPSKANVIDGKWGMGKWKWITGTSGLPPDDGVKKPVKKGYFGQFYEREELPPRPKGLVLIQKKHLDEAKWAIRQGLHFIECTVDCGIKTRVQIQMREVLKNISSKPGGEGRGK
jgi:hypothetical protein